MSDWWIPRSPDELETALRDRTVVENHYLEFKQFDRQGKVPETIGRSVAGLAVDGGVLVIGAKELKDERRFQPDPRVLVGLPEAVDQIIATRVAPNVRVSVYALDRDDGTGYLVVIVPASARAPHMVDGRYIGRDETTSRVLADVEVRALWQRHLERRERIGDVIAAEVKREPVAEAHRTNARLFVIAQPVSADPRLLLDAVPGRDLLAWVQGLNDNLLYKRGRMYSPTFASGGASQRRAHGVARSSDYLDSDRTVRVEDGANHPAHSLLVDLEYREDGGLRLYYGRASDHHRVRNVRWLMLAAIVGEVAGIIHAARVVSEQASYRGPWSFGVALRGIRGIAAFDNNAMFHDGWKFSEDDYDEVAEVDFDTLHEPGCPVLELLVGRLVRATTGIIDWIPEKDPFAVQPPPSEAPPAT